MIITTWSINLKLASLISLRSEKIPKMNIVNVTIIMFFNSKIKNHRINSLEQKKYQLKKYKIDFLIIIRFNKKFSSLTAEKFIKEIIYNKTKSSFLYVSKNFKFGYKRRGNIQTLKKYDERVHAPHQIM